MRRDVTSGARAPSVGTGGRCVRESAREWSRGEGGKGERVQEDLERGESQKRGRGGGKREGDEGRGWDEANPLRLLVAPHAGAPESEGGGGE